MGLGGKSQTRWPMGLGMCQYPRTMFQGFGGRWLHSAPEAITCESCPWTCHLGYRGAVDTAGPPEGTGGAVARASCPPLVMEECFPEPLPAVRAHATGSPTPPQRGPESLSQDANPTFTPEPGRLCSPTPPA